MKINTFLFYFLTIFIFIACDDEPVNPSNNNNNSLNLPTYTQYGTPLTAVPATDNIIMYEINLRAFSQNGDLQGVIDRLDNLKDLGVNVIWLMPIHPIGEINSVNSPYSVKDYKAVASEYGTFENLKTLTDEAHQRGIAVIMDWVANHTSWDNDWINNKDWYTQDGDGNIIHPAGTNWQDVADLNFGNADMREHMINAMKYWILEANVDGFRCDYADGVPYDFWKRAIDSLEAIPNRDIIMLAEGTRDNHYDAGFQMTYGWEFYGKVKEIWTGAAASTLYYSHTNEYNIIPEGKHKLRFTTNHDESAWDATPMTLFGGKEGALAVSVATIFMGGVPLIYTGQEVGRFSTVPFFSNSPINWNANSDMLQAYQAILGFYQSSDVAKLGTLASYPNSDVMVFSKTYNGEELAIFINVRDNPINYDLANAFKNSTWTNAISNTSVSLGTTLTLGSYEYLILKK